MSLNGFDDPSSAGGHIEYIQFNQMLSGQQANPLHVKLYFTVILWSEGQAEQYYFISWIKL